jgi:mediator of RNA polymerase II transcription subunit 23
MFENVDFFRFAGIEQKYPEKYYFEMVPEMAQQPQHQYLPVYFGNICLRFLPVSSLETFLFVKFIAINY